MLGGNINSLPLSMLDVGFFIGDFDKGEGILVYLCLLRILIKMDAESFQILYCHDHVFISLSLSIYMVHYTG